MVIRLFRIGGSAIVGAGDCDIAMGKGSDDFGVNSGVVVTVARVFGLSVPLVADVSTDGLPF